jgi:hypothetical protein
MRTAVASTARALGSGLGLPSCPGRRLSPTTLALLIDRPDLARRRSRPGRSGQSELDDGDDALPANWLMSHGLLCPSRVFGVRFCLSPSRARSRLSKPHTGLKRQRLASTFLQPCACSGRTS